MSITKCSPVYTRRERHRERVQREQPAPTAGQLPEEQHEQHRVGGVERRHCRDRVGEVARAGEDPGAVGEPDVGPHLVDDLRGRRQEPVLARHPRRHRRIERVGEERGEGEEDEQDERTAGTDRGRTSTGARRLWDGSRWSMISAPRSKKAWGNQRSNRPQLAERASLSLDGVRAWNKASAALAWTRCGSLRLLSRSVSRTWLAYQQSIPARKSTTLFSALDARMTLDSGSSCGLCHLPPFARTAQGVMNANSFGRCPADAS